MAKKLSPEKLELRNTKDYFDCISPGTVRFMTDHYIVGDSYRFHAVFIQVIRKTLSSFSDRKDIEPVRTKTHQTSPTCGTKSYIGIKRILDLLF